MKQNVQLLKYYYLLTPFFAAADILFDLNIRINIPGGHAAVEYVYYIICFFSSFIVFKTALSAALFSLVECIINILLLALSVMWPIITLGEKIDGSGTTQFNFGMPELIHFIIAGGVLLYSFYTNPLIMEGQRRIEKV